MRRRTMGGPIRKFMDMIIGVGIGMLAVGFIYALFLPVKKGYEVDACSEFQPCRGLGCLTEVQNENYKTW